MGVARVTGLGQPGRRSEIHLGDARQQLVHLRQLVVDGRSDLEAQARPAECCDSGDQVGLIGSGVHRPRVARSEPGGNVWPAKAGSSGRAGSPRLPGRYAFQLS